MFGEGLQEPEFRAREDHHLTLLVFEAPPLKVEHAAGEAKPVRDGRSVGFAVLRARPAAQNILDTRHQLARLERLGHVVVRAHLQAQDAVDRLAPRGQHDHGQRRCGAQIAAEAQAVFMGQVQIKDDQIDRVAIDHPPHRAATVGGDRREAVVLQLLGQERADIAVIVDDQNAGADLHPGDLGARRRRFHSEVVSECTRRPPAAHRLQLAAVRYSSIPNGLRGAV